MANISRPRLEFAASGFLSEMRKQFVKLRPGDECPIQLLAEYSPEQRSALMAAVQKSIQYSQADHDKLFAAWSERQAAAAED